MKRKQEKGLTRSYAVYRSGLMESIHYDLCLTLSENQDSFFGEVTIGFNLHRKSPITIDFWQGKIVELFINGREIKKPSYESIFIDVPSRYLNQGKNQIQVKFSHPYSTTGVGLYRFKDPQDGRIYLYSDFEPQDANHMFPCFDQPDLKATFTLTVEAPGQWQVISSTRESKIINLSSTLKRWIFPPTGKMSTYVFSMHAGPYKMWKEASFHIPLRLFARQSFAKYIEPQSWFTLTKQGFRFYERFFGVRYPFLKYDQIIVPDFNSGAMENIAAVTFNEAYIPRGAWTEEQRENIAEVILHEMAHMWFGNLVTMKWWNDLWLNESFASYMATMATYRATEFKKAWFSFFLDMKQWAYWEDQLVTSHPIVTQVHDTEHAMVNFDGITYGKGASVLKQLSYLIGEEAFRRGVHAYFKTYAYRNTVMNDFIHALSQASGQDLTRWTRQWLMKAGLNSVEVNLRGLDQKIVELSLLQTSDRFNVLRTHKTNLSFLRLHQNKVILSQSIAVTYQGKRTKVRRGRGKPVPLLIYPNHEDFDYVKVSCDAKTVDVLEMHLSTVQDDFTRMMLWQTLWDQVLIAKLPLQKFSMILFKHLPSEKNIQSATRVAARFKQISHFWPQQNDQQVAIRDQFVLESERFLWTLLREAPPKSDFQKLWFDSLTTFVESQEGRGILFELIRGSKTVKGMSVDQDRRWKAIVRLSLLGDPRAARLRSQEANKDSSEKGIQFLLASQVSQPRREIKQKWFKKITSQQTSLSLARLKVAMSHLFPSTQDHFRIDYGKAFFKNLLKLSPHQEPHFLSYYTQSLAPAIGTEESVSQLRQFIHRHQDLPPVVMKRLRVAAQEDERAVKIRKVSVSF